MKMALLRIQVVFAALLCSASLLRSAQAVELTASQASNSRANPIRRVVTMLQSMAKKVEEEGEKEKSLYEKYMCYCKTSSGTLQEGISAAETKIPQVEAALEEAKSKKEQLDAAVKEHIEARNAALHAIADAESLRKKANEAFTKEEAEYVANIEALEGAIAAISKGIGSSFLQTKGATALKKMLVSFEKMSDDDRELLASFLQGGNGYVPQSGQILGMLKQIKDEMEKSLAEIRSEEAKEAATSAQLVEAKKHEGVALSLAAEEKSGRSNELGVQIAEMGHDLEDTQEALAEDQKFLADMDKNCEEKKAEWESISKLRAEELVAISETIKILNDDDALELFKKTLPSPSLMQVTSSAKAMQKRALSMVSRVRTRATTPTQKAGLDLLAVALTGKKMSFEKVMTMIDNLVVTLAKEQEDDDKKKAYCEKEFDESDDQKKDLERSIKDLNLAIDEAEGLLSTLSEEIKAIKESIKALDKDVAESTETRKEEHDAYTELMSSDSAAKELIGFAKNRLQKFYNPKLYKAPPKRELSEADTIVVKFGGTAPPTPAPGGIAGTGVMALVQLHKQTDDKVAPPPPPESFGPYTKKAEENNGVLAMLDMLVADLDKEMQEAEVDEKNAQAEYETFMEDAAAKRALDSKTLTDKESAKAEAEADLQASKESKTAKKSELMSVEEYIAGMHSSCDWLLKNFDLRKSARAEEVDALKSAKAVLAGADYSLVQSKVTRALRGHS